MIANLETLKTLTQSFDPIYRPVRDKDGRLGPSYVPEAHEESREQLEALLILNDNAKLLLAGQPGCGKTTLLLHLAAELRDRGRIVAFVDLEVMTAVQDLGFAEMHIAATAELLRAAHRAGATMGPGALAACEAWLAPLSDRRPGPDPAALADSLAGLLAAARDSADVRRQLRDLVKQGPGRDPYSLLVAVLDDLADRRPVVILDGLDKVPPDPAREFFLHDKRKPMAEAPGAAILTIPLSIVYEPTFNVLSERYNNADNAVLPAIRLFSFDAAGHTRVPSAAGYRVLARIVEARLKPGGRELVMPDAIDRAIRGSGGNIRELARLMQASIVKAVVRKGDFIEEQDVAAAIADQRESYRRAYQPRFLPVLRKVRDHGELDNTDDVGKLLLYGLWVMEYRNGTAWYCLPEPVEQLVAQLDRSGG